MGLSDSISEREYICERYAVGAYDRFNPSLGVSMLQKPPRFVAEGTDAATPASQPQYIRERDFFRIGVSGWLRAAS